MTRLPKRTGALCSVSPLDVWGAWGGRCCPASPPTAGPSAPPLFQGQPQATVQGEVARGVVGLVLLVACAGADELGSDLEELGELGELEAEQIEAKPIDCRPVRFANCANAWNDRACFYVPPECAIRPSL